jgi:hypothetical protein
METNQRYKLDDLVFGDNFSTTHLERFFHGRVRKKKKHHKSINSPFKLQ